MNIRNILFNENNVQKLYDEIYYTPLNRLQKGNSPYPYDYVYNILFKSAVWIVMEN